MAATKVQVRGNPTPEELAALVTVISSVAAPGSEPPAPPSRWNDRRSLLRRPLDPGPGAWRFGR